MEFTKDIYFNNSLTNGKTATITYTGELYRNGAECVNLVSGFGANWEHTTSRPMEKTDNGFVAEIDMQDYDTFNFCFSDTNNVWDNNNSFNYVSPILPAVKDTQLDLDFEFDSLEEFMNGPIENDNNQEITYGTDYSASIDDIIEDILGNTVQNSIANDNESVQDILDNITQQSMPEIEALFNELFFEDLDGELEDNSEPILESTPSNNAEIAALFDELFEDAEKPIFYENATFNLAAFNLDGLVADLLEPVIAAPFNPNNETSLFDNREENTISEETSLVALDNGLQVASRKLNTFYKFKKRISLALYKIFVKAPKEIAKQLGFNID